MMDKDNRPFSLREAYYEIFPKWFVDCVLSPFEDEVGWFPVVAKMSGIGIIIGTPVFLFLSDEALDHLFRGVMVAMVALLLFLLSNRARP